MHQVLRPLLMDTLTTDAIDSTGVFDAQAIQSMFRDLPRLTIPDSIGLYCGVTRWLIPLLEKEACAVPLDQP